MAEVKLTTKTSFLKIMGDSPTNKVLDYLIENDRESWSMNEIAENANVGYSTLKLVLPSMIKNNLIIITKKVGKIRLYQINKENSIIKKLYNLYKEINLKSIENLK